MIEEITSDKLTKQIFLFRDFLIKNWGILDALLANHDWRNDDEFVEDWIQVNWEFLVERELLGGEKHITPLSNFIESRVLFIESYDFSVVTFSEEDLINSRDNKFVPKGTRLRLIGFSSKNEFDGPRLCPPFDFGDFVIDEDKKEFVYFPLDKFRFHLESFNPDYFK